MIDGINQLPAQTYFYQKDIIGFGGLRDVLRWEAFGASRIYSKHVVFQEASGSTLPIFPPWTLHSAA